MYNLKMIKQYHIIYNMGSEYYYCNKCGTILGYFNDVDLDFNPTGNKYQIKKFIKHTLHPKYSKKTISIFEMHENKRYKGFFINPLTSGCVEVDNRGTSLIWIGGKKQGYTTRGGKIIGDDDGVKVVLYTDPEHIHAYPIRSQKLITDKCSSCGATIIK
jgi:hypothetical protein